MKRTLFLLYYVVPLGIFVLSSLVTRALFASSHVPLFRNFLFSLMLIAIPSVLFYLVVLAVVRIVSELRSGRLGSRFQARILLSFFVLIAVTVLPLFFFLNGFFQRAFQTWSLADLNEALESAYAITRDRTAADRALLHAAAGVFLKMPSSSWQDVVRGQAFRDSGIASCSVIRSGRTVFSWADRPSASGLVSVSDLADYDLKGGLLLTRTRQSEAFAVLVETVPDGSAPTALVLARRIDPGVYERSGKIEKGYLLYRQLDLLRKPYRQALTVMMVDFSLFVLFLALILSILLARQISKPVVQIYEGFQNIAAGRLDFFIEYKRQDEMKVLVQAFNNMTKELFFNQQAVLHSQHIEAWKRVASRQIDDLKRQSGVLVKSGRQMLEQTDEADSRRQELTDLLQRLQEMDRTVQQFESFTSVPKLTLRKENLNEIIREVMEIFEGTRANISFFVELDNSIPLVSVNRAQIYQALVNLVKNAVEAVLPRAKGLVKLRTEYQSNLKGGLVRVEVVDSGVGIPSDRTARIWEPYFTTKRNKQGLGLTIVKRIVEEHSGRIVYRRIDGRSVFTMEFGL